MTALIGLSALAETADHLGAVAWPLRWWLLAIATAAAAGLAFTPWRNEPAR